MKNFTIPILNVRTSASITKEEQQWVMKNIPELPIPAWLQRIKRENWYAILTKDLSEAHSICYLRDIGYVEGNTNKWIESKFAEFEQESAQLLEKYEIILERTRTLYRLDGWQLAEFKKRFTARKLSKAKK